MLLDAASEETVKTLAEQIRQVREEAAKQTRQVREEAAEHTRQVREEAAEQTRQAREQAEEQTRQVREEAAANAALVQSLAAQLSVNNRNNMVIYVANLLADFTRKFSKASPSSSHAPKQGKQKLKYPELDKVSKKILEKEAEPVRPSPRSCMKLMDE
jgi:vacuolar-type H+-ATPase subunit H